ncbi:MAG: hypothetical protein K6F48_02395 [Paludibacteraceae bacterium]|nr:hypothetical protein [Paludibacteraceae bacterium]
MESKKFLFILPAKEENLPYISTYKSILDTHNVNYRVIYWNRHRDAHNYSDNYIAYEKETNDEYSAPRKIYDIYRFYRFVLKHLKKVSYDGIFIYTIADSIFFYKYLSKHYKNRYVFDIRDYSPILKFPYFRYALNHLLNKSAFNVISSEGFKQFLPQEESYVITHNITLNEIENANIHNNNCNQDKPYNIITIGKLRDEKVNIDIIKTLGNRTDVKLSFVGMGPASQTIKNHVERNKPFNVTITGKYLKQDEDKYVLNANMLNVCMEQNILSKYLLSNRLYLGARLRRPLLTYDDDYQSLVIKKYKLGLLVSRNENIYDKIINYWETFDYDMYNQGCIWFLHDVENDLKNFEKKIVKFITE